MIARVILPTRGVHPAIKTLEVGTHFMCQRTSTDARETVGVYQVLNNDPGIFDRHGLKIPAVNCATGFVRLFDPNALVEPVEMVLAPAKK